MSVTLTSPVEGLSTGDTYSGPNEDWLVLNGYASRPGNFDGLHASDVPAVKDPTLAANREAPPVQGGDVDAVAAEDGEKILAFDERPDNPLLEVAPQARLVPAGLEGTDPRVHGTGVHIDGSEYGEDKLTKKIQAQDKAARPAEDNPLLEVAPQADARSVAEKAEGADKASAKAVAAGEKALAAADSEIPESSASAGVSQSELVEKQAEAPAES